MFFWGRKNNKTSRSVTACRPDLASVNDEKGQAGHSPYVSSGYCARMINRLLEEKESTGRDVPSEKRAMPRSERQEGLIWGSVGRGRKERTQTGTKEAGQGEAQPHCYFCSVNSPLSQRKGPMLLNEC